LLIPTVALTDGEKAWQNLNSPKQHTQWDTNSICVHLDSCVTIYGVQPPRQLSNLCK